MTVDCQLYPLVEYIIKMILGLEGISNQPRCEIIQFLEKLTYWVMYYIRYKCVYAVLALVVQKSRKLSAADFNQVNVL